jgi:hypothetical protein
MDAASNVVRRRSSRAVAKRGERKEKRSAMRAKSELRNEYRCSIELNQNGKYCVRIRAWFARNQWNLSVYFLASTFDRGIKKLESTLQFLQKSEERLWFWGVDRTDDPNLAAELLRAEALEADRRNDFPDRSPSLAVVPDRPVPAFALAPVRRNLAESLNQVRAVAAGD